MAGTRSDLDLEQQLEIALDVARYSPAALELLDLALDAIRAEMHEARAA